MFSSYKLHINGDTHVNNKYLDHWIDTLHFPNKYIYRERYLPQDPTFVKQHPTPRLKNT